MKFLLRGICFNFLLLASIQSVRAMEDREDGSRAEHNKQLSTTQEAVQSSKKELQESAADLRDCHFTLWELVAAGRIKIDQRSTTLSLNNKKIQSLEGLENYNLTNLKQLWLTCNKLKCLPQNIEKLTKLELFNLSGNQLVELHSIGKLTNLKRLWLNCNKLKSLPDGIGNLTKLEGLWLRNNKLKGLPATLGKLIQLFGLYLDGNRLEDLSQSIESLTNLAELTLNNNKLKSLPDCIGKLIKLRWLCLGNNQLESLPECINLQNLADLTHISLDGNKFNLEEERKIKERLKGIDIKI